MKNSAFIFVVIIVSCIMVLQTTCLHQAKASEPAVSKDKPSLPQPADANAKPVVEPNGPPPVLKVEAAMYDFGEVGVKTANNCQFKFTNIGKGKLIIKTVRATCGCTVPALAKQEYEPGESGTIEVHFTAPGEEGDTVKHLYIVSNDKKNPEAELILKAKVITKVKFEPLILKLSLKDKNAACPPITLKSTDGKPFAIKSFQATAECITIDFDPNVTATEFVLKPKVDTDKLRKILNGGVSIGLTHPQCEQVNLFFEATAVYTLNPPMIMILNAKQGTPITREVYVLNNYKEPFEIESVSSQKGIVKLVSQEKQDNGYKLVVAVTPPVSAKTKIKIFSDTIFVNIKGGEKLEINCRGFFEKDTKKTNK